MATRHSANVFIINKTDGTAYIQLFHRNDSNGIQNGSWTAGPGETAGPLTVRFETAWDSFAIPDWWSVIVTVEGGSAPGIYQNAGTDDSPGWTGRRLHREDADRDLTFAVGTASFDIATASGGSSDTMARHGDFSKITNVFVLMLENHSFDNIFGQSGIPGILHAAPAQSNTYQGVRYNVGSHAPATMATDPAHEFPDVVEQLAGPGATYPRGGPYPEITGSGFAASYATSTTEGPAPPAADIGEIMLGFDTSTQLPVLYTLATEFAVCDHWFSSLPGPTWPNRFFVHGASSAGLDHSPSGLEMASWELWSGFAYPHGSIFELLSRAQLGWRIYCDDGNAYSDDPQDGSVLGGIPQVSALRGVTLLDVHPVGRLAADLQNPYTSRYTFIEPNYGDITHTYRGGSSQHPMDDVYGGEGLIKAVYEAIRNSPVWDTSLLIITYDEHGGFYDSVSPGPAVAPDDGSPATYNKFGFSFTQLGVRVPAVVVSPWIPAGTVDPTVYDHSSVPATIERLFGLPSLTKRDEQAHDVRGLLTQPRPRTDAPTALPNPAPPAPRAASTASTSRAASTPAALAARDSEPVPESGNLPGFLHIMLKTDLEMAATPAARQAALARYAAVRTRGDARAYIADVVTRARITKADTAQR